MKLIPYALYLQVVDELKRARLMVAALERLGFRFEVKR